jgi:hypothetical protein
MNNENSEKIGVFRILFLTEEGDQKNSARVTRGKCR